MVDEGRGRIDLRDTAVIHHHDSVGHYEGFFLIMCDIAVGGAILALKFLQFQPQGRRTSTPSADMGSSNRMISGDSASVRAMATLCCFVLMRRHAYGFQNAQRCLFGIFAPFRTAFERIGHVAQHGHVLEQRIVLDNDAHTSLGGQHVRDDAGAVEEEGIQGFKSDEAAEYSRLAAA